MLALCCVANGEECNTLRFIALRTEKNATACAANSKKLVALCKSKLPKLEKAMIVLVITGISVHLLKEGQLTVHANFVELIVLRNF